MTATFDEREFRLLVLGAGFSKPAGFPLALELWPEVLQVVDSEYGRDNAVRRDLSDFRTYKAKTTGIFLENADIDFEEFVAFLDLEHYLGLRGSDTWSSAGNQSQLMLRWAIGFVLHERLERLARIPDVYLRFVERLRPSDVVMTFNYDTLLEAAFDSSGTNYRLFPHRFSSIGTTANTVDSSRDEVVLLKLHGSVDWFDRTPYAERERIAAATETATGVSYQPGDPVFGPDRVVSPIPLTDGPRSEEDPLRQLYRVLDPGPLYRPGHRSATPFLLSPSFNKLFYSTPLHEFWNGLGKAGGWQLGMGIIGFSLPQHDEYLRQVLYRVCSNYTDVWWDESFGGRFKAPLKLIDKRASQESIDALRARYSFLNWVRVEVLTDGFDVPAIDSLFADRRGDG